MKSGLLIVVYIVWRLGVTPSHFGAAADAIANEKSANPESKSVLPSVSAATERRIILPETGPSTALSLGLNVPLIFLALSALLALLYRMKCKSRSAIVSSRKRNGKKRNLPIPSASVRHQTFRKVAPDPCGSPQYDEAIDSNEASFAFNSPKSMTNKTNQNRVHVHVSKAPSNGEHTNDSLYEYLDAHTGKYASAEVPTPRTLPSITDLPSHSPIVATDHSRSPYYIDAINPRKEGITVSDPKSSSMIDNTKQDCIHVQMATTPHKGGPTYDSLRAGLKTPEDAKAEAQGCDYTRLSARTQAHPNSYESIGPQGNDVHSGESPESPPGLKPDGHTLSTCDVTYNAPDSVEYSNASAPGTQAV
eukprot:scpid66007/ scgid9031/ 